MLLQIVFVVVEDIYFATFFLLTAVDFLKALPNGLPGQELILVGQLSGEGDISWLWIPIGDFLMVCCQDLYSLRFSCVS